MSDKLREPIEDRWKSTLWENNPELLEYTSSLERKLKIAEEALIDLLVEAECLYVNYYPNSFRKSAKTYFSESYEALSKLKEQ